MAEDFTTFTQVEEIDDIQTTATHVDFADRRDRITYPYRITLQAARVRFGEVADWASSR